MNLLRPGTRLRQQAVRARSLSSVVATPGAPAGAYFSFIAHPDYCASDASHLVKCTAGDTIRWWKDAVSGTWVEQATSGSRATLRSGGGGRWGAEFAGGQHYDATTLLADYARNVGGLTVASVFYRASETATDERIFFASIAAVKGTVRTLLRHASNVGSIGGRTTDGGTFTAAASGTAASGWRSLVGLLDYAGGPIALRQNGAQVGTNTFAAPATLPNTASLAVLIGQSGGANFFTGVVRELHGFQSVLSGANLTSLESRLAAAAV